MKWPAPVVAGFALEAGWSGEDWTVAVAMALAASGGDDAYHSLGQVGSRPDQRGLWAIDVTVHPEPTDADLYDANVNARWAHQLWASAGGTWTWHPTWQARAWLPQMAAAAAAIQRPAGHWAGSGWQPPMDPTGASRAVAAQATVGRDYRPLSDLGVGGGAISDVGTPPIGGNGNGAGLADSQPTTDNGLGSGRPISGRDGGDIPNDIGDNGAGASPAPGVLGSGGQEPSAGIRDAHIRRRGALTWGWA